MAAITPKLADVVKEIRAILDSTPNGLTSKQVEGDYSELCSGKSLKNSTRKLGYSDVDDFLSSLARDGHVKIHYNNNGDCFYSAGTSDSSTAHIQQMVKRQVSKKGRSRSRGAAGSNVQKIKTPVKKSLPNASQSNIIQLLRGRQTEMSLSNFQQAYHNRYGAQLNFKSSGFSTLKEAIMSVDNVVIKQEGDHAKIFCRPISSLMSTNHVAVVKRKLSNDVLKVLRSCNGQVLLTDFTSLYNKVIGQPLSPANYGHSSLLNLLNDMEDTVNLERTGDMGDWIIKILTNKDSVEGQPSSNRVSLEVIKQMMIDVIKSNSSGIHLTDFEQVFQTKTGMKLVPMTYGYLTINSLLKALDSKQVEITNGRYGAMICMRGSDVKSSQFIPESVSSNLHDALGPGVAFNQPPKIPVNQYVEVFVSQIVNPSHFYIQVMADDNTGKRLEELMDLLEASYNQSERYKQYILPESFAEPDQIVVCRYPNDNNWHRAQIIRVMDNNFVQVIFVDYGTCCAVNKTKLYYMRQKFLALPAQAQLSTLHGIIPIDETGWSNSASKSFLNLTSGKRLCAKVIEVDRDQKLSICLSDTSNAIDLHINDYLVSSNFAQFIGAEKDLPQQDFSQIDKLNWSVSSDESSDEEDVPATHFTNPLTANTNVPPTTKTGNCLNRRPVESLTDESQLQYDPATMPPLIRSESVPENKTRVALECDENTLPPLERFNEFKPADIIHPQSQPFNRQSNQSSLSGQRKQQTATVKPMAPNQHPHRMRPPHVVYRSGQPQVPNIASHPPPSVQQPMMQLYQPSPYYMPQQMSYGYYPLHPRPYHPSVSPYIGHPAVIRPPPNHINSYHPAFQHSPVNPSYQHHHRVNMIRVQESHPSLQQPHSHVQESRPQTQESQPQTQVSPQRYQHGKTQAEGTKSLSKPPPLIPRSQLEEEARTNQSVDQTKGTSQQDVDQLRFRLNGLQLKHKRLMRERYIQESADFSGAESSSSEDELPALENDIKECMEQLAKLTGKTSCTNSKTLTTGRGRGNLLLKLG